MKTRSTLATFYTIVITQAFSMIGSRLSSLAIGIWLFQQTGNVTPLALVAVFAQLPMVLSANVAGVIADRFDRRLIMALADVGQAICTILLLLLFLTGNFRVEYLYVLTFLQALAGSFQFPAFTASVSMLVPDEHRTRANAIQQLSEPVGGLIAPALAGLLYSVVGITGVIMIDLFTFSVAVIVIFLSHIPSPPKTESDTKPSVWSELTLGLRFIASHRALIILMTLSATINFLGNGVDAIMTPYILLRTNNNEVLLGTLLSVMNAGAIIGGLFISVWGGTRKRIHTVFPAVILSGLARVLYGMGQDPLTLGIAMFGMMFFPAVANAPIFSLWQSKIPVEIQGRVFSAIFQIAMLTTPLGQAIIGPLADKVFEPAVGTPGWAVVAPLVGTTPGSGIGLLAVIAGVGVAIVAVVGYLSPTIQHMERNLAETVPTAEQSVV